ncbi:MAG: UMP kinase [Candidatus Obscuribacterales bacterium]|nr:UMP kinase [Candidatus Obscuribacterales bacterium]
MPESRYKRIILKISGEALQGSKDFGLDDKVTLQLADEIVQAHKLGVQIVVVVGGSNICKGLMGAALDMEQAASDYVGMVATIMNSLVLQECISNKGVDTRVQTAISMPKVAEPYVRLRAVRHLEKGRIVILGGGTGNPYVTTDSAAALRAAELQAELLMMAKNGVDGVYTDDPKKNPNAKILARIGFDEFLEHRLEVIDTAAISICQANKIPICVFDCLGKGNIANILSGKSIGTIIDIA